VVQKLRDTLLSAAKSMVDDASNDSEVLAKALKIANGLRAAFPDNKFVRVANECLETDDSVKSAISTFKAEVVNWAIREAYGYRARDAVAFENEDVFAMWSWYITKSNAVFSNQEQAIVKECIATRSRYGRAVKATLKVAEQLQTTPDFENAAVLSAQERASKAILEVERAKQKRQELERKRLSDLSKAQQKEDQKLAKQREKEEAATRKKEEAVAEAAAAAERKRAAEEAAAQEKRLHEETLQKKLDKQRSLMQAFLQVAPKPSAPFDSSSAKGAVAPVVAESTAASSVATPDTGFDLAEFESLVFSGPMALSDIPRGDLRR
jgi:FKBP-type peptidyl-prolyl cis-trans isomerase